MRRRSQRCIKCESFFWLSRYSIVRLGVHDLPATPLESAYIFLADRRNRHIASLAISRRKGNGGPRLALGKRVRLEHLRGLHEYSVGNESAACCHNESVAHALYGVSSECWIDLFRADGHHADPGRGSDGRQSLALARKKSAADRAQVDWLRHRNLLAMLEYRERDRFADTAHLRFIA